MSWSWYLYTTRAPPEVFAADRELDAALARYQDDHDDGDDYYAETGPGGSAPPSAEHVIARYRESARRCSRGSRSGVVAVHSVRRARPTSRSDP